MSHRLYTDTEQCKTIIYCAEGSLSMKKKIPMEGDSGSF